MAHKNPRRRVLAELREIKKLTGIIASRWDVRATIYLTLAEREAKDGDRLPYLRPRLDAEYPENNPYEWERLAQYMRGIAARAREIERYAYERQCALTPTTPGEGG